MIRRSNRTSIYSLSTASMLILLISVSFPGISGAVAPVPLKGQDPGIQVPPSAAAVRDLYERARYDDARQMLDILIRQGNVSAEVLYYRGLVEPEAVIAIENYFDRITRRYPGTEMADRARFRIAQYRYDSGFYITARRLFGEVAWSQGDSPLGQAARYWRGMTWLHSLDKPDSLRVGLRLVKDAARRATDPEIVGRALISTADLSLRIGEPDSALAYATVVIEIPYLGDHHPPALGIQARAYDSLGDVEQASILNQTLVARYPDTWEGREARKWLAQQREAAVQARLDSMRAMGGPGMAQTGTGEGRWTIQVGAFTNLGNATQLVMQLTREGHLAWHTTKRVEGNLYVVVHVGRFGTRAEATAFGNSLLEGSIITEFQPVEITPP